MWRKVLICKPGLSIYGSGSQTPDLGTFAMNKLLKILSVTLVSLISSGALAASAASGPRTMSPIEIKAAVNAYLLGTVVQTAQGPVQSKLPASTLRDGIQPRDRRDDDCNRPHDPQACVDAACAKLGSWGCDEQSEVTEVLRACRGNRDASCLNTVCGKLGSWGCDELSEIKQVAAACQNNDGSRCIEVACAKLGSWGCDELSEVTKVSAACAGQYDDGACLTSVCARLGSWGCDEMTEILQVLNECSGR